MDLVGRCTIKGCVSLHACIQPRMSRRRPEIRCKLYAMLFFRAAAYTPRMRRLPPPVPISTGLRTEQLTERPDSRIIETIVGLPLPGLAL